MDSSSALEHRLNQHLQDVMTALEFLDEEQGRIEKQIGDLRSKLSKTEDKKKIQQIQLETLEALREPEDLPSDADTPARGRLGPMQQAALDALPEHPNAALPVATLKEKLNSQGYSIKRTQDVHKVLLKLEDRHLANYVKRGRAHFWYKTKP
ncbi:hypothetical protein [Kordiimonas gwangyangensis]|uniref:hypothetical protein n=1 Tax=Kordiimonas gwangyangensis TaxID=288022 RepID=UPI00037A5BA2|nr:hypothetical protein [Kordiimonas gwangyangensis]